MYRKKAKLNIQSNIYISRGKKGVNILLPQIPRKNHIAKEKSIQMIMRMEHERHDDR